MIEFEVDDGVLVYTDGSFSGKSKVGGWAFCAVNADMQEFAMRGWEPETTNNRMEIMGAVAALENLAIEFGAIEVEVVTDSAYLCNGYSEWLPGWKLSGWVTKGGTDVKNVDLWRRLDEAVKAHLWVGWRRVKGHAGHKWNELVDELAGKARTEGELCLR